MDYIDYREKLGLGFNDAEKQQQFINRIRVFLYSDKCIDFDREQETAFAYSIGVPSIIEEDKARSIIRLDELYGIKRAWLYLEKKQKRFADFLSALIMLANNHVGTKRNKNLITDAIKKAFDASHIPYELYQDDAGVFFFPNGAKELDKALVSEPLVWLSEYPKTQKTFSRALRQYSDGEYVRDVADNLRKALEEFFQEVLKNKRNLDNNKADICRYLSTHNAEPEIASMMQALLNSYNSLNNSAAKHNDKLDPKYLEFLMYQTGLIIRMIITVGEKE